MKDFLSAFLILLSSFATAQDQTFSVDDLKEDFAIFQGSLEDFHPGLYWYRDKKEMDKIFESARAKLSTPMTERAFYRALASIISKVGCGHTYTSLSKATLEEELVAYLPFQLQFEAGKAFYIKSYGEGQTAINPGNEVTHVNGVPMDSLYLSCLDMLPGDGFSKTGQLNTLNAHFWYTYAELFDAPNNYEIQFLDDHFNKQTFTIPAMPKEEMYAHYFKKDESVEAKQNVILTFDGRIANLRIKAFFGWKEGGKRLSIEKRLNEAFSEIKAKGATQLIIDLRDNGGGRVPWVMYSYFVEEPFLFARGADFIFTKSSPYYPYQKLHPNIKWIKNKWLNTWLPSSNKMSRIDGERYRLTGLFMTKPYTPTGPMFEGDVYILTNGGTFSAASDFAAMMKSSGLATILGRESGGGYYGNTSMEKSYVTLPNTKIQLEIPLVRHELNVDSNKNPLGRGVIPDHEVLPSVEDLIQGIDRQMEWTMEFVKKP